MARRRQTSGLPKKSRQEQEQAESKGLFNRVLGNPTTRAEREDAINTLLQRISIGVVALIVIIILAVSGYRTLLVPTFAVAHVNGEKISVSEFRDRVALEQLLVAQQAQARYAQAQQQANLFNIDVNQVLQQDQLFQQMSQELQLVDILGQRVLNDMIRDVLVEQEAEARDIQINDDQIDSQINEFFGYDPTQAALIGEPPTETPEPTTSPTPFVSPTPTNTPLPTSTPTPTPEATAEVTAEATEEPTALPTSLPAPTQSAEDVLAEFETNRDLFRDGLKDQGGISDDDIDAFFQRQALRQALLEAVVITDTTAPFVSARHILVETEEEALEVIAALERGEPFSSLAQAVSTDTGSGSNGGELGWAPAANYVSEFQDAVLSAEIGAIVGPVKSQFGYHVIQVRAREERDIEGSQRDQLRNAEFQKWLETLREDNEVNIEISDDWPSYLPSN